MASFWRKPFMSAVYGFGIALVLTVAAGSVVGWSTAVPAPNRELEQARNAQVSAEQRADRTEAELDEVRKQLEVVRSGSGQGGKGQVQPDTPQGNLVIEVKSKVGGRTFQPAEVAEMALSFQTEPQGGGQNAVPMPPDGVFSVPRPAKGTEIKNVCVKPAKKWKFADDPTVQPLNGDLDRVACVRDPSLLRADAGNLKVAFVLELQPGQV